jgi:LemA protein
MEKWIVTGGLVLVALYLISAFNRLVTLRYRMRDAWAQIDVQLKRRYDLIPNLVNAVKGYMEHERTVLENVVHERTVLENVVHARQQAMSAGSELSARATAESALSAATSRLMALAEAYPALRANESVLALQEELASTENRIAFARQFYNDSVMEYNTARSTFPRNFLAAPFGFPSAEMFALEDSAQRHAPQVRI